MTETACTATLTHGHGISFCVLPAGHGGEHKDIAVVSALMTDTTTYR